MHSGPILRQNRNSEQVNDIVANILKSVEISGKPLKIRYATRESPLIIENPRLELVKGLFQVSKITENQSISCKLLIENLVSLGVSIHPSVISNVFLK